jgi:two-component system, cell cycle sensor histidine kinase and response regulator CckA
MSAVDAEGGLCWHNHAARELFGARHPLEVVVPEDRDRLQRLCVAPGAWCADGPPRPIGFLPPGGPQLWLEASATRSGEGSVSPTTVIQWWNITPWFGQTECFRRSMGMFEHVRDSIIATDLSGVVTYWNAGAERLFGWKASEMIGRPYIDRIPEDGKADVLSHLASRAEGTSFEGQFLDWRKDGTRVWIDARVGRYFDAAGQPAGIVGISHDITERKRAEEELSRSQARLKSILNAIPDAVFLVSESGVVGEVFSSRPQILVRSPQELGGARLEELAPQNVLDAVGPVLHRVAATGQAESLTVEGDFDSVHRHFDLLVAPDMPAGWIVVVTEITARVQAESALERRMQQAQKLESLGLLAGGIAHDFNNLLTGILGFADLARDSTPPDLPAARHLSEIETSARRAAELCRQLLAYAGRGKFVSKPVSLSDVVAEMYELLAAVISKRARFELQLARNLPAIEVDPSQIRQVVMNLLTNASDAVDAAGGEVRIRTGQCEIDNQVDVGTFVAGDAAPGNYVFLEVRDTGCGMTPEVAALVFDPFYSTKPSGRGLGLAAVIGIIRAHRGMIRLSSDPGRGSCFTVYIPASRLPAESLTARPVGARSNHRRGEILAIDDEPALRLLIRTGLESAGFRVVVAASGQDGLSQFDRPKQRFDAAIVDLTLPDLRGQELITQLKSRQAELPIVVISGYSEEELGDWYQRFSNTTFLQKPFTVPELVGALRGVLGR